VFAKFTRCSSGPEWVSQSRAANAYCLNAGGLQNLFGL
jgi:hypothetical protein